MHVTTRLDILRLDSRSSIQEEEEDRGEGHRPVESSSIDSAGSVGIAARDWARGVSWGKLIKHFCENIALTARERKQAQGAASRQLDLRRQPLRCALGWWQAFSTATHSLHCLPRRRLPRHARVALREPAKKVRQDVERREARKATRSL